MIICSTKFKISKEFLVQEYIKNKKAIVTIAKILGCSYPIIRKNLIRYDIKIRTYSEAVKNSYKKSPKLKIKVRGSFLGSFLGRACHLKTNRNRKIWINYFNSVL